MANFYQGQFGYFCLRLLAFVLHVLVLFYFTFVLFLLFSVRLYLWTNWLKAVSKTTLSFCSGSKSFLTPIIRGVTMTPLPPGVGSTWGVRPRPPMGRGLACPWPQMDTVEWTHLHLEALLNHHRVQPVFSCFIFLVTKFDLWTCLKLIIVIFSLNCWTNRG